MTTRRTILRGLGATATFGLAGCASMGGQASGASTRTITDGMGREVDIPETVERTVGVGPGALRQIAYLDATERVVGVEDEKDELVRKVPYNQANPQLADLPVIGSAGPNAGGNSEQLIKVDPDVIFFFGEGSRAETLQKKTGVPVICLQIVDIVDQDARETMYKTWVLIGDVLGKTDRAETLIEFVYETVTDLDERTDNIPGEDRASAYVGAINYKGSHGISTTRKDFSPFRFANVENVASDIDIEGVSVQVDPENLIKWDPSTIFVGSDNLSQVREDLESDYQDIEAVKNGAVYPILPHASYHHNYGSILTNSYFVGKTLYPDRFEDVNLESKANDIFEAMLGARVYDQLLDSYEVYQPIE